MSSAIRESSQIPVNKLYINVGAVQSTIYQEASTILAPVSWVTNAAVLGQLSTSGSAIFRDMGKTIYLGSGNGGASQSTILRKVQLVTNAGTGTGAVTGDASYLTGYISLGGQTYGGGDASAARVARLN